MDRRRFLELTGAAAVTALTGCGGGSSGSSATPVPAPTPTPTPAPTPAGGPDWQGLDNSIGGTVVRSGSDDYALAAIVVNSRFNSLKPQAVVTCTNADDVARVLAFVKQNSLAVTPRCGRHSYAGFSATSGVVIDVSPMSAVQINADGTAKVGAGAKLSKVYSTLIAQGVCIPSGSCSSVGISGITMGGGVGLLDRKYGLTCDNLVAAEVVTADGKLVQCDANNEPDLFWAVRGGGGGNFGVATSFTYRTHAIQDLTTAVAFFNFADGAKVFDAWQAWGATLPDTIWAQVFIDFSGGAPTPTFKVFCVCAGSKADLDPYWNAFLAAAQSTPLTSGVFVQSYGAVINTPEFGGTSAFVASSDFFNQALPSSGIQAMLQSISDQQAAGASGYIIFDLMGGAIGRVATDVTAFPHRNALFGAQYFLYANVTVASPTWPNDMRTLMQPWSSGGAYVNYADLLIQDWKTAYYGANYARLAQAKTKYDPDQLFRIAQGVTPA